MAIFIDEYTGEVECSDPEVEEYLGFPRKTKTPDMDILRRVLVCPPRTKSDFARDHLNTLLRLTEHGLVTTYDPVQREFGSTFYLTEAGSVAVWRASR